MFTKKKHASMRTETAKRGGVFALALALIVGTAFPAPGLLRNAFADDGDQQQEIPAYMTDVTDATVVEDEVAATSAADEFSIEEQKFPERDQYLQENVNESIAPIAEEQPANPLDFLRTLVFGKDKADMTSSGYAMYTKYTYADRAVVDEIEASTGQPWDIDANPEGIFGQYTGYQDLLDPGADSDYYVAYTDITNMKGLGEIVETSFTLADVSGTVVDGPIMDGETGIAYVPKSIFTDGTLPSETLTTEDGESVNGVLTLQYQTIIKTDFVDTSETDIDFTIESMDSSISPYFTKGSISYPKYDVQFNVPLVSEEYSAAFDLSALHVYLNGSEYEENITDNDEYAYDDEGILTIPIAPTQVYSVKIVIDPQQTIERAYAISAGQMNSVPGVKFSITNSDQLKVGAHTIVTGSAVLDGQENKTTWAQYAYTWVNSAGYSATTAVDSLLAHATKSLADASSAYSGGVGLHRHLSACAEMNRANRMPESFTIGSSKFTNVGSWPWDRYFGLFCSHATTAAVNLGAGASTNMRISVLAYNTNGNHPYIVLGLVAGTHESQPGVALYKFDLDLGEEFEIEKRITDVPQGWDATKAGYTVNGCTFTLYDSKTGGKKVKDISGNTIEGLTVKAAPGQTGTAKWSGKVRPGTYYLEETSVPANMEKLSERVKIDITAGGTNKFKIDNKVKKVKINVQKTSTNKESLNNPYYNFKDIQYQLTCDDAGVMKPVTFTLDANGKSTQSVEVPYNHSYTLKETKTNQWYKLNPTPVKTPQKIKSDYTFKVSDDPVMMTIDLNKVTDNPDVLNGAPGTYDLEGAKYLLTNTRAKSGKGHNTTMVTDAKGHAKSIEILYDDWNVKETYSSNGHAVNGSDIELPHDTFNGLFPNPADGKVRNYTIPSDKTVEPTKFADWSIEKKDADTGMNVPTGKASLEGAVYEVKYYDTTDATAVQKGTVKVNRTWYVATDKDGHASIASVKEGDLTRSTFQNTVPVTKTFKSDAPYMNKDKTKNILPVGTITVTEVLNPVGYLFDNGSVSGPGNTYLHVNSERDHVTTEPALALIADESIEQVYRGDYEFDKVREDNTPLADIPFAFISKTTGETHALVTDENGQSNTAAAWVAHTLDTNKSDAGIGQNEHKDWIATAEEAISHAHGYWFTGFGPLNNTQQYVDKSKPSDEVGALPYDDYSMIEVSSSKNDGLTLIKRDVNIARANVTVDGGTIVDKEITLNTTATDDFTGAHEGDATRETVTIIDEVAYTNLDTDKTYTITGTLMDKATGEPLKDADGNTFVVTPEPFTPAASDGTVKVVFQVPGAALIGKTTVVFEKLESTQRVEKTHEDIDDEGQTVNFPEIHTTATDATTGTHEGSSEPETITVNDVVKYSALQPGKSYVLEGKLMDKSTGNPLKDADGNDIVKSIELTPEAADGEVPIEFTVAREVIEGKTVVVFENLYRQNILVAVHADINDEDQTVHYPKLRTTATDGTTLDHEGLATEVTVINDEVQYWNLKKGEKYTMEGVLMDKSTGEVLKGADGKEFKVTKEFVAGEDTSAEAQSAVTDPKALSAEYMSVLDKFLTAYDAWVASHDNKPYKPATEITDKIEAAAAQAGTNFASDPDAVVPLVMSALSGDAAIQAFTMDVIDSFYQNELTEAQRAEIGTVPSKEAIDNVLAALAKMKEEAVAAPEANADTAAATETATDENAEGTETAENAEAAAVEKKADEAGVVDETRCDGTVTLSFMVPRDVIAGHSTVVFEDLYFDVTGNGDVKKVGSHSDINDEGQTVNYPALGTEATIDGEHEVERQIGDTEITLVDTVSYTSLVPGKEYVVSGVLMYNKRLEDNKFEPTPVTMHEDKSEIRAQTTFTPTEANGTVEVTFTFDAAQVEAVTLNETMTVFESLYTASPTDADQLILVGEHADITDKAQTVKVQVSADSSKTKVLQTGDIILYVTIGGLLIVGAGIGFALYRRKFMN